MIGSRTLTLDVLFKAIGCDFCFTYDRERIVLVVQTIEYFLSSTVEVKVVSFSHVSERLS